MPLVEFTRDTGGGTTSVSTKSPLPVALYPAPSVAPKGYQQVTSLTAVKGLTIPAGATYALISPEGQAVRYRDDGQDPTTTVGMPLAAGETLRYEGNLSALRFIEQTASARLNVSFYG